MKCRYTLAASAELDEGVSYLLIQAPHVAGEFADSIEAAGGELLEHPYSAQQTALAGVYRKYVRAFRYSIF
jgi:plasmid stabilization system protein ParE